MRTPRSPVIGRARLGYAARLLVLATTLATSPAFGDEPPATVPAPATSREAELEARVQRLEEMNQRVLEQYETLSKKYEALESRLEAGTAKGTTSPAPEGPPTPSPTLPIVPAPEDDDGQGQGQGDADSKKPTDPIVGDDATSGIWTAPNPSPKKDEDGKDRSHFRADYDDGFVIAPDDEDRYPFLLRINGRMQFRQTTFARDRKFWRDSAGTNLEIRNRSDFEIERGRLVFSGFFLDPKLEYYLNIDFDTDDNHDFVAHDFWVNYQFSEAFDLHFGKAFVPGSRAWLGGSTRTQFADRALGNTFFRPDRSVGVWAQGEPVENVFYRTMMANGFNTTDLTFDDIDLHYAWASSVWWDVFGNYGSGYPDLDWHEDPAWLGGASFTTARNSGPGPINQSALERNFVRLSDGTQLTLPDAIAPGLTVNQFDIYLLALDLAAKYRGFSFNGEYYLRWIQDIGGFGAPVPFTTMFDHGFYVEGGYFLIPRKFEVIARTSQIWGPYGTGAEYAGGFNWYVNGTHDWKFTFDATRVIGSPAENSGPNYNAGDTGVMFRSQLQTAF
ncbi:MAG: porin [Isosphaeraceae bacterium]